MLPTKYRRPQVFLLLLLLLSTAVAVTICYRRNIDGRKLYHCYHLSYRQTKFLTIRITGGRNSLSTIKTFINLNYQAINKLFMIYIYIIKKYNGLRN